jgi:hypothetical protein
MHLLLNIKSHGVYIVYYYCIFVKQNIQTKKKKQNTMISRRYFSTEKVERKFN